MMNYLDGFKTSLLVTFFAVPQLLFQSPAISNSSTAINKTLSKDSAGNLGCPQGAFAKELVAKSNQRFGIRCYKASLNGVSTKVDKGEFWTRKFIQLDNNRKVQASQSASCPTNRFVDEIVFDDNKKFIAIRCRYVQAQLNGKNHRGTWSSDFWSRQFTSADASQMNSAQCPNSSVIAEVIQKSGGLYIRCRQVMVNGSPLNFAGDYWTRFFATRNQIPNNSQNVKLPITASRGFATWEIDSNGVVTSYIKYTVGYGSGSKKYGTGLVVEFADSQIYTAKATKTVGRPGVGTDSDIAQNQSHTAIPVDKLNEIRRIYIKNDDNLDDSPNTINEWLNQVVDWANEADRIYKELKDNDLIRDAVVYSSGAGV